MLVMLQRPEMKQKLCGFVRLSEKKKRPDVPKWNPVAPGEVTPAVQLGSQSIMPREPGHTFRSS